MGLSIEVRGLDAVQRKLGVDLQPAMRMATRAIAEIVRGKLATYPGPPRYPLRWASLKQKRAYFAMRRRAGLPLKYTRNSDPMSQRLGPSWTVADRGEIGSVVGTRVSYAKWGQDAKFQQPMHAATGWVTDEMVLREAVASGVIQKIVTQVIMGGFK